MKIFKRILFILSVIFIIIQFNRPARNIGEIKPVNEITAAFAVPSDLQHILRTSCYDCHSNNTRYPWYVNIQPFGWFMESHIKEGKGKMNFSEFATYPLRRQYNKFNDIIENVSDGEMPLPSYLLIHTDAKLSDAQKKKLIDWANAMRDSMQTKYPADSLQSKINTHLKNKRETL
jgi:hypothetical protein